MKVYLDKKLSIEDLKSTSAEPLTRDWTSFDPSGTRERLLADGGFDKTKVKPFLVGPLDIQWAYVDATPYLWNRARSKSLLPHAVSDARFLVARIRAPRLDDGAPLLAASCLGSEHSVHKHAYFIPFVAHPTDIGNGLFEPAPPTPNYSARSGQYLATLGLSADYQSYAGLLWWHALAVAYAPSYVAENPGGIAMDWPRIPLPSSLDTLLGSAHLGELIMDLLDPLRPVQQGTLLMTVAPIRRIDGGTAQPAQGHLEVRALWGIGQKDGTVMPGRGRIVPRPFTEAESAALGDGSGGWGGACDIYLNEGTYWSGVPEPVWEFKIGGFQVLKKWLSYREHGNGHPGLLGRGLTNEEAREFSNLARRITAVVSLKAALDANYSAVKSDCWQWYDPS